MSCEQEAVSILRHAELKLTPQRVHVLTTLRHAHGHLTANAIFEQVRAVYPYVDISTIYRTLGVLKQLRLISETNLGEGELAYEWIGDRPHHHLVCSSCGTIADLDPSYFEPLSARLLAERGFAASFDHFAIFGCCAACRR
jgi:Fur family ferric uptake transcriptional regulator